MSKIEMNKTQMESLEQVLDYIFEHETADFAQEHLDEDFEDTEEEWAEIDQKIVSKEIDVPHVYCSAIRVQNALNKNKKKK